MNRDQWFSNPANINGLRKLIEEPAFKEAIIVLETENRHRIRQIAQKMDRETVTDAAQFNEQSGFVRFLAELEELASEPPKKRTDLKPDYSTQSEFDRIADDPQGIQDELERYTAETHQPPIETAS